MYASGVPLGVMIDGRGPRLAIFLGALAVGVGYYPLHVGQYTRTWWLEELC